MKDKKFTRELASISGRLLKTDVDLKPYSYLKTGGIASYFIYLSDTIIAEEEGESDLREKTLNRLRTIIDFLVKNKKTYRILGKGSNIIIKDGIVEPVIIYLQLNKSFQWEKLTDSPNGHKKKRLTLPASLPLIRALKISYDLHLQGLEFYMGIPGTVGGAVTMNAGVKNQETKDVLVLATLLRDNQIQVVKRNDLDMSYRHTNIGKNDIVIQAEFELNKITFKEVNQLKKKNLKSLEDRKRTQPLYMPSVGSTFKNPLPEYAGALIEKCGLKNRKYGGIRISPTHANFLINDGGGTSADALHLIKIIRETVFSRTGIFLEMEAQKFGF